MKPSLLWITAALLSTLHVVVSYKILAVNFIPQSSHNILGFNMVKLLVEAGHEVTFLTPYPPKEQIKNLHVIDMSFIAQRAISIDPKQGPPSRFFIKDYAYSFHEAAMESEIFQSLINDPSKAFDAVVTAWFHNDAIAGLPHIFQCPWIIAVPLGLHVWVDYSLNQLESPAVYPSFRNPHKSPMTLWQRIDSTFDYIAHVWQAFSKEHPRDAGLYNRVFAPAAVKRGVSLPSHADAVKNASFVLLNSHPSLGYAHKAPPNSAEVAGYHIDEVIPPLPQDLQPLLDFSTIGVIYFSLGGNLKSADMAKETKEQLLELFAKLPYTILWKFEGHIEGVPKNVFIRKWFPQQSILAHKNTKAFITHGGLLSTTEAVHFGVPIIGIPMFADQFMNVKQSTTKGYAISVEFHNPNFIRLLGEAIAEIIGNESYSNNVRALSQAYHDRAVKPAALLVHSVESTIRSKGASHLKPLAVNIPIYQQLLLDQIALAILSILFIVYIVKKIFRRIVMRFKSRKVKKE